MAASGTITRSWHDGKMIHVIGTISFSGSYSTGGDTFDLTASLVDARPGFTGMQTNKQPEYVDIAGKAGFVYTYDMANKKIMVYTNTAGGANNALGEHTAAAYAAGVTGDTVKFYAIFPR